ncbi:MAG TPA: hypothetical protein VFV23_11345 [Verrucomicrobiae bacterium]|nr:hypothetical protein [Verrucomicrobiae bacterium]
MALVITLILLSVTLVMAIAFLAISRRERSSVTTQTDATTSRLAADAALSKAESEIIANLMGNSTNNNPYNFGLLVSTNYINPVGLGGSLNPTNVNYDYLVNGNPLSSDSFLTNVANLFLDPRPPVYIQTNSLGSNDFRFYLDLNRNDVFDDSGRVPFTYFSGATLTTNGTTFATGDPQWIGILTRPDTSHGPDNFFVSRYAFAAIPVGNAMDLNYIHNQAKSQSLATADDFFRNESVGTWEINLAAFLADLNTNQWGQIVGSGPGAPAGSATWYQYYRPFGLANAGHAFEDARSLLLWRYGNNYSSLATLQAVMGNGNGYSTYANGRIDLYDLGLWMTNASLPFITLPTSGNSSPWLGSDNANHFFDLTADLFDSSKSSANFVTRLQNADAGIDTYDRYTFYRLLSQLGTDSEPERDKMDVNYINVTNGDVVVNMQTNFVPWTNSLAFFTNAADRLLRAYSAQWFKENPSNYLATYYGFVGYNYYYTNSAGIIYTNNPQGLGASHLTNYFGLPNVLGITNDGVLSFGLGNIPVLVSNKFVYASSVNRLLQLAANIYDATTNSFYPSVFKPIFEQDFSYNVFITGYTNISAVADAGDAQLRLPYDLRNLRGDFSTTYFAPLIDPLVNAYINVYGVPWIIGAKKGFPNFNEFSMNNVVQSTRKLQIKRRDWSMPPVFDYTNVLYVLSVGSSMGIEFWNSYYTNYPDRADIFIRENLSVGITNEVGGPLYGNSFTVFTNITYDPAAGNPWPGSGSWPSGSLQNNYTNGSPSPFSFAFQTTNLMVLTNAAFQFSPENFVNAGLGVWQTNDTSLPVLPDIGLIITNHIQSFILDNGHVIDYVQFDGPNSSRDLAAEIQTTGITADYTNMWSTARPNGTPIGIVNQILASKAGMPVDQTYWRNNIQDSEIDGFYVFMNGTPQNAQNALPIPLTTRGDKKAFNDYLTNLVHQVPFTPTVTVWDYTTWQANDPLVHNLAIDLSFSETDILPPTGISRTFKPKDGYWKGTENIGKLNTRYQPWGRIYKPSDLVGDQNAYNLSYKDPMTYTSDFWDFPTNKFPSIGWLGRVHRGTPWQTVYLKATDILVETNSSGGTGVIGLNVGVPTWTNWVGEADAFDAVNSAPGQDRILFDLFTTAPNDNATRGQLSVNVEAGNTNDPAAGLAAWSALFSGMAVPTTLTNTYDIINPAGVDTFNSALWQMVTNINYTRAHFTNTDGTVGVFEHVGDIFAVPLLTEHSPFLHNAYLSGLITTPDTQINDELYEWLPQQAMSLLRVSKAPRYVIYCYGQTLKPAQNGLVTGSQFFGMCTNYVPVAETAIRAVVRVDDANTPHPHIVVESYNVLPPD